MCIRDSHAQRACACGRKLHALTRKISNKTTHICREKTAKSAFFLGARSALSGNGAEGVGYRNRFERGGCHGNFAKRPKTIFSNQTNPKNPERLARCRSAFEVQCFRNCTLSSLCCSLNLLPSCTRNPPPSSPHFSRSFFVGLLTCFKGCREYMAYSSSST